MKRFHIPGGVSCRVENGVSLFTPICPRCDIEGSGLYVGVACHRCGDALLVPFGPEKSFMVDVASSSERFFAHVDPYGTMERDQNTGVRIARVSSLCGTSVDVSEPRRSNPLEVSPRCRESSHVRVPYIIPWRDSAKRLSPPVGSHPCACEKEDEDFCSAKAGAFQKIETSADEKEMKKQDETVDVAVHFAGAGTSGTTEEGKGNVVKSEGLLEGLAANSETPEEQLPLVEFPNPMNSAVLGVPSPDVVIEEIITETEDGEPDQSHD